MSLALKLATKFGEVVDFPVVSDPDGAVFVAQRHVAVGRQIQNSQAATSQPDIRTVGKSAIPEAGIVRSAMRLHVSHPRQRFTIPAIHDAAYAAHALG